MMLSKQVITKRIFTMLFISLFSSAAWSLSFVEHTIKLANEGDAFQLSHLGVMYEAGNGVPQSYTKAIEWYQAAIDQGGYPTAHCHLGRMYYNGNGVKKDLQKAAEIFRKGDLQRDSCSQYVLGNMYYEGIGFHQNYASAFNFYEKAASAGHTSAKDKLAWMYYEGKGVRHDYSKALILFKELAKYTLSFSSAQYQIGVMYYKGEGVNKDVLLAKEWFGIACDNGNQGGCDVYREINK